MDDKTRKPIRILHVLTAMNRAGAETMLMNLYRAIDREKVQFDFAVTIKDHGDYDDEIVSLGGRVIRYPKYTGKNHFTYKKWWYNFFEAHPEYRIIHGHIGSTASIYLGEAKKFGCFTIAHSHSTGGKTSFHDLVYKLYSYSTRYVADFFIGCSTEALISRYGKKVYADEKRSCVLKNGVDVYKYSYSPKAREEVGKEFGFNNDTFVIGTVGRFVEAKNTPFIVDILADLKKKVDDFYFIWAGDGELKEETERLVKQKNLANNVIFLGIRNDIPRILQMLNVFILPSKYEGLPVVGIEVQAAGVPMLCSEKVSSEVKVSDGVSFLPIDSTKPWVDGILNERVFRRISDSTERVIEAGYDIRNTSRWLMDFYERNWR